MIKQSSDILNKLFFTELQMLVEKYNKIDEDIVTFFVWCNLEIKPISIHQSKEFIEELKSNKYIEIEEYLIYQDERYLKGYARELLEDRLYQEYYVDKLFEKETIIEMWINKITKDEMIDEIVGSGNLEEALEFYPQEAFSLGGIQYKYAELEE